MDSQRFRNLLYFLQFTPICLNSFISVSSGIFFLIDSKILIQSKFKLFLKNSCPRVKKSSYFDYHAFAFLHVDFSFLYSYIHSQIQEISYKSRFYLQVKKKQSKRKPSAFEALSKLGNHMKTTEKA